MSNLPFYGPFHFKDIDSKTGKFLPNKNLQNAPNPDCRGIYIWGFMYNYDNKNNFLDDATNFNNHDIKFNKDTMKFIPYYIGKDENKMFNNRILKHYDVRNSTHNSDADGYTRLSLPYMKEFFKDKDSEDSSFPAFPIHIDTRSFKNKIIQLLAKNKTLLTYFNSPEVLHQINQDIITKEEPKGKNTTKTKKFYYPITQQKTNNGKELCDTLLYLVERMNNFWFCFAPIEKTQKMLGTYEITVYYSLKGRTLSKTQCFQKADHNLIITDNPNMQIFKKDKNNRIIPTPEFPGYLDKQD